MTAAEAIEYLQPIADNESMKYYRTALNLAIDALREKQRMEEMVPLVLKAESTSRVNQMLDELKHLKPTICTVDEEIEVVDRRWIPVTEKLPEERKDLLVFGYYHEAFQVLICHYRSDFNGEWFTSVAGQKVYEVTHWMPLPAKPPKEE